MKKKKPIHIFESSTSEKSIREYRKKFIVEKIAALVLFILTVIFLIILLIIDFNIQIIIIVSLTVLPFLFLILALNHPPSFFNSYLIDSAKNRFYIEMYSDYMIISAGEYGHISKYLLPYRNIIDGKKYKSDIEVPSVGLHGPSYKKFRMKRGYFFALQTDKKNLYLLKLKRKYGIEDFKELRKEKIQEIKSSFIILDITDIELFKDIVREGGGIRGS